MTSALTVSLPFQGTLLLLACVLYAWIIQRLRRRFPAELVRIDSRGYRGLNAGSQLRFSIWLVCGRFRAIDDPALRWACRAFLVIFLLFTLGWLVPLLTFRG
ncbi:MAG: hypothetical protein ACO3Z6_10555 [Pseudomonadales bacterium]